MKVETTENYKRACKHGKDTDQSNAKINFTDDSFTSHMNLNEKPRFNSINLNEQSIAYKNDFKNNLNTLSSIDTSTNLVHLTKHHLKSNANLKRKRVNSPSYKERRRITR